MAADTLADAGMVNFGAVHASEAFAQQYARDQGEAGPMAGHSPRLMVGPPIEALDFPEKLGTPEFSEVEKGDGPAEFLESIKGGTSSGPDLSKPVIAADLAAHPFWTTGGTLPAELIAFARVLWRGPASSSRPWPIVPSFPGRGSPTPSRDVSAFRRLPRAVSLRR